MSVVFIDTETTGLHADHHEIWEVALVTDRSETSWLLPVNVADADPVALSIGRFHERHPWGNRAKMPGEPTPILQFLHEFRQMTDGHHLAGAVVSFDEERLRRLLWSHGMAPSWHYHLVDVEALAAGKLGLPPPWDSNNLSRRVGVNPDDFERHSALGDALWAKAVYEAVIP